MSCLNYFLPFLVAAITAVSLFFALTVLNNPVFALGLSVTLFGSLTAIILAIHFNTSAKT